MLPTGMQAGDKVNAVDEWEMVVVEEVAMMSMTESVESVIPSFEKARKQPD